MPPDPRPCRGGEDRGQGENAGGQDAGGAGQITGGQDARNGGDNGRQHGDAGSQGKGNGQLHGVLVVLPVASLAMLWTPALRRRRRSR